MKDPLKITQPLQSDIPCLFNIIKTDDDFSLIYSNEPFLKLIGYSADEIQYKFANHLSALLDTKTVKVLRDSVKQATSTSVIELEHAITDAKGHDIWLYSIVNLSHSKDEGLIYLFSHDINPYKKTEFDLEELREDVALLFENISIVQVNFERDSGLITSIHSGSGFHGSLHIGEPLFDQLKAQNLIHPTSIKKFSNCLKQAQQNERHAVCEIQIKTSATQYKWMKLSLSPGTHIDRPFISAVFIDITAEKDAITKYLNVALFYQAILGSKDAYGQIDISGDKVQRVGGLWNLYYEHSQLLTYTSIFCKLICKSIHPKELARYLEITKRDNILASYQSGITHLTCELRYSVEENRTPWMKLTIELFENPVNKHLMSLFHLKNIDLQKKRLFLPEQQDTHDPLTKLYNKDNIISQIKEYRDFVQQDNVCALILLDIDDFHSINRQLGYKTGDTLLQDVSRILTNVFCKNDIIGRFGGDNFLVFVKDPNSLQFLEKRLDSILQSVAALEDGAASISAGIVFARQDDILDTLLSQVNCALVKAQSKGGGQYLTYSKDFSESDIADAIEGQLKKQKKMFEQWDENYTSDLGSFLDENGEIAYLVEPYTFNLICANQSFYNRIGRTEPECVGSKCYELLHHRTNPCPFCGNASWSSEKFYMYRNYNEVLKQDFLIKNKLVQWYGKEALFALAIALPDDRNGLDIMKNVITEDRAIISGVQHMQNADDLDDMMASGLESIGKFFHADFVQFWVPESQETLYKNKYTWTDHSTNAAKCLPNISEIAETSLWLRDRKWTDQFFADNKEAMICSSYDLFKRMERCGFHNQKWVSLYSDIGVEIGVFEVNNISANLRTTSFLRSFTTFIASEWQKRKMVEALIRSGFYDRLTGLLNRASYERFISEFSESDVTSIGIVFINVDGLKKVNESLGYRAGNNYLIQLSGILRRIFDNQNIYRMSGDEFLVLLKDNTQREVEEGIAAIEDTLAEIKLFTVSIGYAWDNIERDPDKLLKHATQSMKINKARYHASLEQDSNERVELLGWVMKAIENEQMLVYLQPKINSRTGAVIGAEALVRYRDNHGNIVPPANFIQPLERSNLIRYIDFFVFEEICKTLNRWAENGISPLRISLNFSRITISENNLITSLETITEKYHTDRSLIEIEITESSGDIGKALLYKAANNLTNAGYHIALDDFGTQYTNLAILSEINAHVLKIDKSLVHSIVTDRKTGLILKNVLQMCRDLEIDVFAEGVETDSQRQILDDLGCYYIQGYLYSKPLSIKDFEERFL